MKQRGSRRADVWLPCFALVLMMTGCATPYFEVDDAMQLEDGRIRFKAFAERDQGPFHGGVEGVNVRFLVDGSQVASATSDDRGVASVVTRIAPQRERFEAAADYAGERFRRQGSVVQWRSDQVVAMCDIDSTISDTSLGALFFEETDERSQPIADSARVLKEIARSHGVVYFTARPKFTLEKTQRWLRVHGYPEGPVLTSLEVGDLLAQGRYKRREIRKLRETFPNILIGIGNSNTDSEGYGANGMLSLIVKRESDTRYGRHEIEFEDWRQLGRFFEANHELLGDAERLRAASRGEELVLVPTLRFLDPADAE